MNCKIEIEKPLQKYVKVVKRSNIFGRQKMFIELLVPSETLRGVCGSFSLYWELAKHVMVPGSLYKARRRLSLRGEDFVIESGAIVCPVKTVLTLVQCTSKQILSEKEKLFFDVKYVAVVTKGTETWEEVSLSNKYFRASGGANVFGIWPKPNDDYSDQIVKYKKTIPPIISTTMEKIR